MKFINPLPFVSDMKASIGFYRDILGLKMLSDHEDFAQFEGGFALHDGASLHATIFGADRVTRGPFGKGNLVLYFEEDDLDGLFDRIVSEVKVIHPVKVQTWGQRVFRIWDPDRHIIEVGEPHV